MQTTVSCNGKIAKSQRANDNPHKFFLRCRTFPSSRDDTVHAARPFTKYLPSTLNATSLKLIEEKLQPVCSSVTVVPVACRLTPQGRVHFPLFICNPALRDICNRGVIVLNYRGWKMQRGWSPCFFK